MCKLTNAQGDSDFSRRMVPLTACSFIETKAKMETFSERDFQEIYARHRNELLRFVNKLLRDKDQAEDIVHDIFAWIWKHRNDISHVINLRAFMYSIAKHMVCNSIRHTVVKRDYLRNTIIETQDRKPNFNFEFNDTMKIALNHLSQREREVFLLSRLDGMSNKEIARNLRLSQRTIENHITSSLRKLKNFIE